MPLTRTISDEKGVFVQIYDLTNLEKTSFVTPDNFNFQVGFAVNADAKTYQPHVHTPLERSIVGTSEFIFILEGVMDIVFLNEQAEPCGEASLTAQMAFLQLRGGHAISTRPNTQFFELKQGPYSGHDIDKYAVDLPATES